MSHNPDWTEEEIILGLDTYFRTGRSGLNANNAEIIALSELLNRLTIHPRTDRDDTFRNPAGVAMTLRKFLNFDPEYEGEGLRPESGLKEAIWNQYSSDREKLRRAVEGIHAHYEAELNTVSPSSIFSSNELTNLSNAATTLEVSPSPKPNEQSVRWIKFIRQYGPIPRNDAMYDETIQRSARRAGIEPIRFQHPLHDEICACFDLTQATLTSVVLTGDAGDGKTHLCRQVWEQLGGAPDAWSSNDPHLTLQVLYGGGQSASVHFIRDLSAWVPQRDAEWEPEKAALLQGFSRWPFEPPAGEYFLIAANDGQLIETWRRLPDSPEVLRTRDLFETLLVEDRQEEEGVCLKFFNLSRASSADLFDRALNAFLNHSRWSVCFNGEAGQTETFGSRSPIRHNYEFLGTPLVRQRMRQLFELCDYNGLHIPIRHILALLSNALLGHPDCKDKLMQPQDVPKILREGTVAKASLYNNIFGGNLSEARRDDIHVFNYLARFRIGHETTNRIDNLLIFGHAVENLQPYFDALLRADTFYGADDCYRAAQNQYVEGADEDTARSDAFLLQLIAQRRGLFFKIPPEQEEELHLWELTVFKFAGEYLDKVAGVLHNNGKVERPILARLVRGLNRIFVGMLLASDRELFLATSLSFSDARVSRMLEERISVAPRLGEKVEVILHNGKPTLHVALSPTISRYFHMNLTRYEFLSRVAEGALPNSFSKECYEDVLAFKSQILSALAVRRQGEEVDPSVLTFRLLNLDDIGNPVEETVEAVDA